MTTRSSTRQVAAENTVRGTLRPWNGASAGPAPILILDNFTDVNGTALANHTPDIDTAGGGWTIATNGLISNNALGGNSNFEMPLMIDSGVADVTAVAEFATAKSGFGLIVNGVDINNFWMGVVEGTNLRIYERSNGSFTQRASVNIPASSAHTLTLISSGDTLTLTASHVPNSPCAYTVTNRPKKTATFVGVRQFYPAYTYPIDNFQVTA